MDRSFNISKNPIACTLIFACISAMPLQSQAAPGVLPTAPLFLATGVEPNLFFTLDNSNSMTVDTTMSQGRIIGLTVDENGSIKYPGESSRKRSLDFRDILIHTGNIGRWFPPADGTDAEWDKFWVVRNSYANPMYYDPTVAYLPWPGLKANGDPMYENATVTAVRAEPCCEGTIRTFNLNNTITYTAKAGLPASNPTKTAEIYIPHYFTWTDSNNDGIVDVTEPHAEVRILASDTVEMQNFANWYQYHRNRLNTAKYVAGKTIFEGGRVRMGMNMFNPIRGTTTWRFEEIASMQDATKKRELLESLYETRTTGSTPAISAMARTGDYFARNPNDATSLAKFPSTAAPPILSAAEGGECQKNYNILMTDGVWDQEPSGFNHPGNTDGDNNTDFDGGSYGDAWDRTLADMSMKYYENDLRPDLPDRIPTQTGVDEAEHQHLVNYVVSFGVYGSLDPDTDDPTDALFPGWPDPNSGSSQSEKRVDDLWHAAYNARGDYYRAEGAASLLSAFNDIFEDFASRTSSVSSLAVNTSELKANSFVYQASFNSADWSGELQAFKIEDLDTGLLADTPAWSAGEKLTARTNGRRILTYDRANSESVRFSWNRIPDVMKDDLRTDDLGNQEANNDNAKERLDYLKGDRTNEGSGPGDLRVRESRLSDIVNSGPVYVGAPDLNWPDVAPFPDGLNAYSIFKAAKAGRQPVVFVGSNGGLMHAFQANDLNGISANNGRELFAYIPGMLAADGVSEGLHYLTQPDYQHRYQVDLTATVSDAFVSMGGEGTTEWRTVLIGALRGGGRGLFALDATDSAGVRTGDSDTAKLALWEFTAEDDADLGYTYSQPVVALTNAGTWVAIFGNGYNNTGDGKPHLFIVNISKGGDGNWVLDDDYRKIEAGSGSVVAPNGLASPTLADVDGNGTVDRVYAGDLQGKLWAFDLSSSSEGNWGIAHSDGGGNAQPLFVSPDGALTPLTTQSVLARHPSQPDSGSNGPNLMVYFGTGQFLVDGDIDTTDVQSFYGIWDKGDGLVPTNTLVEQAFDPLFIDDLVLTSNPVDYSAKNGWFIELADSGERSVTAPLVRGNIVFFNSYVPGTDPCTSEGYGYRYAVDMATGGAPSRPAVDSNGDNKVDELDLVLDANGDAGVATTVRQDGQLPPPLVVEDLLYTGPEPTKIEELADIPTGRLSWQELTQ